MGTMTVAIKKRGPGMFPAAKGVIADITFSTSYADGGDTLQLKDLGLKSLNMLICGSDAAVPAGGADVTGRSLVVVYGADEFADAKIAAYVQGAGAGPLTEVAAATNMSTVTVRVLAIGEFAHV